MRSGITSKAYVEENEDPFLDRQWVVDLTICQLYAGRQHGFEAFDKYHLGKAPINKLIYKMINSSSAALALKNGELDVLVGLIQQIGRKSNQMKIWY